MSLLGIDIGTSGCKAAAYGHDGRPVAAAAREYPTFYPGPDLAELDSHGVFAALEEALREVSARTACDPIEALSISSMGEAMVPMDRRRQVLGPSILSSDARGGCYVDQLLSIVDKPSLYRINPNIPGTNYSMPKLCWIRDHQGDLYEKAELFLLWADAAAYWLGAEPVTSLSLANRTLLLDLRAGDWSHRLLRACNLDALKLASCIPAGKLIGQVGAQAARRTGLPPGIPIVSGGHDQCCNALGAGIVHNGQAVCGIGTYQCLTPVYDRIPPDEFMLANGLNVEHHVLPGLYVSFIYNQGGVLVRWFRDTFAAELAAATPPEQSVFDRLVAEMPDAPSPVLVLPEFEPTGPPEFLVNCSGMIAGLKTSTTRGEILKAVMESVALYFIRSLHLLKQMGVSTESLVATGGGARSDAWVQIQADVFGMSIARPENIEAGTLGAALLAGLATGAYASVSEAVAATVRFQRTFHPDPLRSAAYREKHERFLRLQQAARMLDKAQVFT
jgi:xylulokinase